MPPRSLGADWLSTQADRPTLSHGQKFERGCALSQRGRADKPKGSTMGQQYVDTLIAILNRETSESSFLHPEVVIHYFPMGRGLERRKVSGIEDAMAWLQYGPGLYKFAAAGPCEAVDPRVDMPACEEAFHTWYEVSQAAANFVNKGEWWLHLQDGKLIGLHHEPNQLEEPVFEPQEVREAPELIACSHDHDHHHNHKDG